MVGFIAIGFVLTFVAGVAIGVIYHSTLLKFVGDGVDELKQRDADADE